MAEDKETIRVDMETMNFINKVSQWFENKKETLKKLSDPELKIKFQNSEGEDVELPAEDEKGFKLGIAIALEVLGEFPVTMTKTTDEDGNNEKENNG